MSLVGRPSGHNWVQYHAETGGYNVTVERDERTAVNPTGRRKLYRYQVQGPNALEGNREGCNGQGRCPTIKFFNMGGLKIAGGRCARCATAWSGAPGLEIFGPWEDGDGRHAAIVEAGKEFGMVRSAPRAYATNTLESGWIPSPAAGGLLRRAR